jgi:peroxiredoxin
MNGHEDTIPDFTFLRPNGTSVKLSDLIESDRTLLLFLRHFA